MTVSVADTVFVAVATLGLALLGWGVQAGALPGVVSGAGASYGALTATFPEWGRAVFGLYMLVGTALGVFLPMVALFAWGRHKSVRTALLPYTLVLLVQIVVEGVFARVFFPNLVIVVGLTYTLYRVWQLWRARVLFVAAAQPVGAKSSVSLVLNASLVYWSFNAVFLVTFMLPRMVTTV